MSTGTLQKAAVVRLDTTPDKGFVVDSVLVRTPSCWYAMIALIGDLKTVILVQR